MPAHLIFIVFFFALGACVGSFLNVVVWRLPRGESLVRPGSHCPKCNAALAWSDNIPILGWIALKGRCKYCHEKISPKYPIVELITALLFVFYYVMFFIGQIGPRPSDVYLGADGLIYRPLNIHLDWPIYMLDMILIAGLLAASLIDAELFIIPIEIPWLIAVIGIAAHAIMPASGAGQLDVGWLGGAVAIGGAIGLILSLILFKLGLIKQSFEKGEPLLEIDRAQIKLEIEEAEAKGHKLVEQNYELPPEYTRGQIRIEIGKEMLFLLPPMIGAMVAATIFIAPGRQAMLEGWLASHWLSGMLGAILGALIGGFVVWLTRILGTLGFGRVAMGLGDVHLMFGVGAVVGAACATIAFFLAPFFGILIAVWMLITGKRRELPYGPYLSLATAVIILLCGPICDYLAPGVNGIIGIVRARTGM